MGWALKPILLTDTHTHICDASFDADRKAVLAQAAAAGIGAVVAVGENLADAQKNIVLAGAYPILKPAAVRAAVADNTQALYGFEPDITAT